MVELLMGGTAYSPPSALSRSLEAELDCSCIARVDGMSNIDFCVGKIVRFISLKAQTDPILLTHRSYGQGAWIIRLPCRYLRDKFLHEESIAILGGVLVQFTPWRAGMTATPVRLNKRVWIRLHNFPEHHYLFEKAYVLVSEFSTLIDVDGGKARRDISSFDIVVHMEDSLRVSRGKRYVYDNCFKREVRFEVMEDVEVDWYMALGIDGQNLSFCEKLYHVREVLSSDGVSRLFI